MTDNMKIWDAVCKTDPKDTKKVTFGRSFTAICPHSQIKAATEQFGPVGQGWGYNCEHGTIFVDDDTLLAFCDVWIWIDGEKASRQVFGPLRGASEIKYKTKDGKKKLDTDAPKKAMTDALTKGLSHLGFNADVFLGLFDDNKYVQQRTKEESAGNKEAQDLAWVTKVIMAMVDKATSVNDLEVMWDKIMPKLQDLDKHARTVLDSEYTSLKEKMK